LKALPVFFLPNLGRFMQSDPLGFDAGDANLFRYCGTDPGGPGGVASKHLTF